MSNPADLPPQYAPADVEPAVTQAWDQARAYHADASADAPPFSVCIPPPNVTAALHLGHALNNTLQDVLTRAARMKGFNTVWLPGTDHAGIATQTVVDKRLQATGEKALKDYKVQEATTGDGREQFIEKVQAWKDEYEARITQQLKDMGCSCDWDRQAFTMDPPRAAAVREAFFQLFKDGLIYRGKRLVNWDPVTQTALADDEVEMQDVDGHFYYMKYPVVRLRPEFEAQADEALDPSHPDRWIDTGRFVTVATTRPETMLGDTAVAVNPDDAPRAQFLGQFVKLPIVGRVIPVISDDYVVIPDPDSDDAKAKMASGFLKVTPAHDPNDYDIGQRHGLPIVNVMAPDASISIDHGWPTAENPADNAELQPFLGLSREDARRAIVRWFKEHDLLEKQVPHKHAVGHSYRSHVPVEPYYSDQWYLRVTDDKLAGAALRAMDASQRQPSDHPAFDPGSTSRDRQGAGPDHHRTAYLITFSTHGSWLHGDPRGSVDRQQNLPGTPYKPASSGLEKHEQQLAGQDPARLDPPQRVSVRDTLQEVCQHRGWSLHAANVRTNHVHVLVSASAEPDKVMNDFKAYATRRLTEAGLHPQGEKLWARHGSTRYLNDQEAWDAARRYVLHEQGEDLGGTFSGEGEGPLPDGRGSSEIHSPATGLTFTPPRYAKTFQTWHENLRDWCISRQLWWGHRIPVWTARLSPDANWEDLSDLVLIPGADDVLFNEDENFHTFIYDNRTGKRWDDSNVQTPSDLLGNDLTFYICAKNDPQESSYLQQLENAGWVQDPDVLDTWFSSALWPMSTLGWPEMTPDLETWNPTSVLCTAREIITLWVSRMVMFNLYFLDRLPFKDVFIHAMIQDGHGQKMSKSLGNGVDPLDIITSHGSDAMRYTLTSMTTQTQDVRLPVDTIDPRSGQTFTPKFITGPGGVKVAAPIQEFPPGSGQQMVSSYGLASGQAQPTADDGELPLARNTSEKFDVGQRFATKLWNATRFALGHLSEDAQRAATVSDRADARTPTAATEASALREGPVPDGPGSSNASELALADRWILSRTRRAVEAADAALAEYDFHNYAGGLYHFVWNEVCDWYIESVKPQGQAEAMATGSRAVLAAVLDVSLRLLHPVMPFVTERLWAALGEVVPERGVAGLTLPGSDLLVHAAWPGRDAGGGFGVAASLHDGSAEAQFERVQAVVGMVREVRNAAKVPPRERPEFSLKIAGDAAETVRTHRALIESLANIALVDAGPEVEKPASAAVISSPLGEGYLHVEIDTAEEADRLSKRKDELEKSLKTLDGRLSNEKYTSKAPAHLVQQTRDQRAAAAEELDRVAAQLAQLGG